MKLMHWTGEMVPQPSLCPLSVQEPVGLSYQSDILSADTEAGEASATTTAVSPASG